MINRCLPAFKNDPFKRRTVRNGTLLHHLQPFRKHQLQKCIAFLDAALRHPFKTLTQGQAFQLRAVIKRLAFNGGQAIGQGQLGDAASGKCLLTHPLDSLTQGQIFQIAAFFEHVGRQQLHLV